MIKYYGDIMSQIKKVLNTSAVFNILSEDDVQRIEILSEKREIHPGDVLASAKDVAQYFFLLNTGTLLLGMEDGRSVVFNTPGDFIGLELLSAKGIYKSTLTVLEKGSVFTIPRQDFLSIIREDSDAAEKIMASWQEYLDITASFSRNIEDLGLPEIL